MANQNDSNKQRPESSPPSFDFGISNLIKGLSELVDVVSETVTDEEGKNVGQSGEVRLKGLDDKVKGLYHFSMRSGLGNSDQRSNVPRPSNIPGRTTIPASKKAPQPQPQSSGNTKPVPKAEMREPLVDVFNEDEEIVIVAEIPGVQMADIRIDVQDDILRIETSGAHQYATELLLDAPVDTTALQQTYRNGILEVRLRKIPNTE